jgi:hypothetical protein
MQFRTAIACVAMMAFSPPISVAYEMRQMDVEPLSKAMQTNRCPVPPLIMTWREQHEACGGDGTLGPCTHGDKVCYANYDKCYKQYWADRDVINDYNTWLKKKCIAKGANVSTLQIDFQKKPIFSSEGSGGSPADAKPRQKPDPATDEPAGRDSLVYDCHVTTTDCIQACLKANQVSDPVFTCNKECSVVDAHHGDMKGTYCFGLLK